MTLQDQARSAGDEARLAQLAAKPALGQQPLRRLKRRKARRVDDRAGHDLDLQLAHVTEEALVFPTEGEVDVTLERVDQHAATQAHAAQLGFLELDQDRYAGLAARSGRRRLHLRFDFDRPKNAQIEQRALGFVQVRLRIRRAGLEVQRAAHLVFRQIGQSFELHVAELGGLTRCHPEADGGDVLRQIDVGALAHAGLRVAVVAQRARQSLGSALELFLVESGVQRQLRRHAAAGLGLHVGRQLFDAMQVDAPQQHRLAFFDHDLDAHFGARANDVGGACMRLIVAATAIQALDAL